MSTIKTHDAMFKALASERHAPALLRDHLPPELAERLDDKAPPRLVEGIYTDEALQSLYSDRLFETALKSGDPVYVLVEHKSWLDLDAPLQLLIYMAGILRNHTRDKPGKRGAPPLIIPILFYHGAERWSAPLSLLEAVTRDETGRHSTQTFYYILRDFENIPPAELSSSPMHRFGFVAMRYATRGPHGRATLDTVLDWWPEPLDERERALENQILGYMMSQFETDHETFNQAVRAAKPERGGISMKTVAQQIEDAGRAVGFAEGRSETLTRQLQRRFGPLPSAVRSRITGASLEELDIWVDQVLDAPSLEAMFGDTFSGKAHPAP